MGSATINGPQYEAVQARTNIAGAIVQSVTWSLDATANICEISVPKKRIHEFRQYNAGRSVYISVRRNYTSKIIFNGYVTGRFFEFSEDNEDVSIVCNGPRWHLFGDFVKGQIMLKKSGEYGVLNGLPCIFNERMPNSLKSPGNAATEKVSTGTFTGIRPFALDPRDNDNSQAYTLNEMLYYIYQHGRLARTPNVLDDVLVISEFGVGDLGDIELYDVNVDGMYVTSAINSCFKRAGMSWWCRPISETQSEIKAFINGPDLDISENGLIIPASNSSRKEKYLYLANVSTGVSPDRAITCYNIASSTNNINAGRLHEDFSGVYNRVHAYGARKKYQETNITLLPGWDWTTWTGLLAQGVSEVRKQLREKTSTDWDTYKDIGRKWILDEDGAVNGTAYDFSTLFGSTNYANRKRRFLGKRVDDTEVTAIQAWDAVSQTYKKCECSFQALEDQAGIYITDSELPEEVYNEGADIKMSTIVLVTLPVQEDIALNRVASLTDSKQQSWIAGVVSGNASGSDDVDRRMPIIIDREYETDNINTTKETDVIADLENFVARKLLNVKDPRVSASFSIPWITVSYEPGDIVYGIRGRDIWFAGMVREVRFDLAENQRTEIILEDMRLAES